MLAKSTPLLITSRKKAIADAGGDVGVVPEGTLPEYILLNDIDIVITSSLQTVSAVRAANANIYIVAMIAHEGNREAFIAARATECVYNFLDKATVEQIIQRFLAHRV